MTTEDRAVEITRCKGSYILTGASGHGVLTHTAEDGSTWRFGCVATPLGYVSVYSDAKRTTFKFIHGRREHHLTENRTMDHRTIVRSAHKFAKEIA